MLLIFYLFVDVQDGERSVKRAAATASAALSVETHEDVDMKTRKEVRIELLMFDFNCPHSSSHLFPLLHLLWK